MSRVGAASRSPMVAALPSPVPPCLSGAAGGRRRVLEEALGWHVEKAVKKQ